MSVLAGVPQGSILRPLPFLIYINGKVKNLGCSIRLFADNTSLYIVVESPNGAAHSLNIDLNTISTWAEAWLVVLNTGKTLSMIFSRKANLPEHSPLLNNIVLTEMDTHTQTPRFNALKYIHLLMGQTELGKHWRTRSDWESNLPKHFISLLLIKTQTQQQRIWQFQCVLTLCMHWSNHIQAITTKAWTRHNLLRALHLELVANHWNRCRTCILLDHY